ncbi:MAG: tRNA dihydrouridine synthase DusB [Ruminococcaceae bacterium]|nr:tRNA dihydrouridine synthase DusB [Oscillospiraceae bacterium]
MKIGNLEFKNNVFLAPMAGVTDLAFRTVSRKYGAALAYSEMISSKALFYKDKKTFDIIKSNKSDTPLAVQIFGSDEKIMASTAKEALSTGAKILDINMGCPAPKVVKCGDGSALLKDIDKIKRIVYAVKNKVDVPVTCKIRSGFDVVCAIECAKAIEDSGADAITVHPRTREMYYSGKADIDIIKKVKETVKIPVIGNGDIFAPEDAKNMLDKTGCDFIMVARGAQGNPFLFKEILDYLKNGTYSQPSNKEKLDTMLWHLELLIDDKGEYVGTREARKHIAWYTKGLKGSAEIRQKVNTTKNYKELTKVVADYFDTL